jgi:2-iminobutanoate/2-iminopropanoate deaminase
MKKAFILNSVPQALGQYSHVIESGGLYFFSGQLGIEPNSGNLVDGGIEKETEQAMENISNALKELGLKFSDVIKTTIYLTSISEFKKVDEIYGKYFKNDFPARSITEVSALAKSANIEIEIIVSGKGTVKEGEKSSNENVSLKDLKELLSSVIEKIVSSTPKKREGGFGDKGHGGDRGGRGGSFSRERSGSFERRERGERRSYGDKNFSKRSVDNERGSFYKAKKEETSKKFDDFNENNRKRRTTE